MIDPKPPANEVPPSPNLTLVSRQSEVDFSTHYQQTSQPVYRYILARVGTIADAHDLTAQAFLAAYENYPRFDHSSTFLTWVIGIARHKIADHYRRQRDEVPLTVASDLPHPAPSPEEATQHSLHMERVAEALAALSEARREAVTMRLFAGMTNPEIAQAMDKTTDAVAMLIHRGIQDLRQRLNIEED